MNTVVNPIIAAAIERNRVATEQDNTYAKATYKKAKKPYIAGICTEREHANLVTYLAEFQAKLNVQLDESVRINADLGHVGEVKVPDTVGMDKNQRYVAYLPYNNWKRIAEFERAVLMLEVAMQNFDLKAFKKIVDGMFERYLDSRRTKTPGEFIINAISDLVAHALDIPADAGGQIIDALRYAGFLTTRKLATQKKHKMFFVKVDFQDWEDLYVLRRQTSKKAAKLACPDEVDENTFMISQAKWRYDQPKMVDSQQDAVNKMNSTRYAFADYVTADVIEDAIYESILPEHEHNAVMRGKMLELYPEDSQLIAGCEGKECSLSAEFAWVSVEVAFARAEFDRIQSNGNVFYITRFHDGVNRVYETTTYFGFQRHKALRKLLRFANKKAVTDAGVESYKSAFFAEYGNHDYDAVMANGDEWGYANAILNPSEPTGSIVYQDATTQGTQLYGVSTGSELLLRQSGAWDLGEGAELVKAYILLADELNEEVGLWLFKQAYINRKGDEIPDSVVCDVFNVDNVKAMHMTKLYNVGKERILTGKGYKAVDYDADESSVIEPEFDTEYETDLSKLGKLRPLLMTLREADIMISSEEIWEIFNKAIYNIARPALTAMAKINGVVYNDETTEIFKWKTPDGVVNQYAMVQSEQRHISWINENGASHSFTHYVKELIPGSQKRGVAPRIIQSMDAYLVRFVNNGVDIDTDLALIHDSFGSHGNDAEEVATTYLEGLVALFEWDPITSILTQISGKQYKSLQPQDEEVRQNIIDNIRASRFAIDY